MTRRRAFAYKATLSVEHVAGGKGLSRKPIGICLVVLLVVTVVLGLQGELRRGSSGSGEPPALRLPNPPAKRRPAVPKNSTASSRPLNPTSRQETAKSSTPVAQVQQNPTTLSNSLDDQVDEEIELANLQRDLSNSKLDKLQDTINDELMDQVVEHYSKAKRHYEAAAKLDPNDFRPYFGLGALYVDSLQRHFATSHAEAVQNFKLAIERNPEFAEAYVGLAYAASQNQQDEEAIAAAKKAIQLKPDYPESHYVLGYAYFGANRYEEAVAPFRKAISLKPTYDRAYLTLGSLFISLKRPTDRLQLFEQWARVAPQKPDAHLNLGSAYYMLERYEEGVQTFKRAIALKPNSPTAHYQLGLCYYRLGDQNSAMEQYRILQKLDPEIAAAFYRLINR